MIATGVAVDDHPLAVALTQREAGLVAFTVGFMDRAKADPFVTRFLGGVAGDLSKGF